MSETTLAKIAITTAADDALSSAVERVNSNFDGGRVTKVDMASWLITRAVGSLNDTMIEEIRRAHFNQVVYLEALVRKLKTTGRENLETDEMATLQAMLGQQTTKRRGRPSKIESQDPAMSSNNPASPEA